MTFKGEEEIKTCPGGLVTIAFFIFMVMYFVFKAYRAAMVQDWRLIQ